MSDRPIIEVENLGKRYRLGATRGGSGGGGANYQTLRESLSQGARRLLPQWRRADGAASSSPPDQTEFWALRDVSFSVQPGEVVGIIGRNGAGKSTLLKILSRITDPTEGRVTLRGRVASLLEVGTGFHPELTGRENIYLNGAVLGMHRKEIKAKFDEIVAFAEVEKFLDTPVKRYSSGMYVRLAFAVAAHLEPEILIVDEVLAVGDAEFQKKCLGKMKDVALGGRTVLLVSHNLSAVKLLCSSGIVLESGHTIQNGVIDECVRAYASREKRSKQTIISHLQHLYTGLVVASIEVNGSSENLVSVESNTNHLDVIIRGHLTEASRIDLEAIIMDLGDTALAFYSPGHETGTTSKLPQGDFTLRRKIRLPARMNRGDYMVSLNLTTHNVKIWATFPRCLQLSVEGTTMNTGRAISYNDGVGWLFLEDSP